MLGHHLVHSLSSRDEAEGQAKLLRLVNQVERILRNTMPTYSWSRIVGHKPEGFGRGRANCLYEVDTQPLMKKAQLICEANVHVPENILKNLSSLRHRRATHLDHWSFEDRLVECCAKSGSLRVQSSHHLRNILHPKAGISIINPLR